MNRVDLPPLLRMVERCLVVMGGILSIWLGYRLFALGITVAQGEARAFGIELRNFGPGLFFAALGAYILVKVLGAAIRTGAADSSAPTQGATTQPRATDGAATTFFFGIEDPTTDSRRWSAKSFFLDTRDLLVKLESGADLAATAAIRNGLQQKLEVITMTPQEYDRYKRLSGKVDQSADEQREFLELEAKLFPLSSPAVLQYA